MIPYIQINLPTYDLMALIGLAASVSFLKLRNRRFGYTKKQLLWLFLAAIIGMLAGSRLMYVLSVFPELLKQGLTVMLLAKHLFTGGFVFYGGLFGAVAGIMLCCHYQNMDVWQALNYAAPAMPLFHMFGRVGCFLAGCCYGIESSFGIPYLGTRRFPVQLLEAVLEFVLVIWLLSYEDKVKEQAGLSEEEDMGKMPKYFLLRRYMTAYAVLRFGLEFLRGDAARGYWGVASTSQWISIFLLAVLGMSWWMMRRKEKDGEKYSEGK